MTIVERKAIRAALKKIHSARWSMECAIVNDKLSEQAADLSDAEGELMAAVAQIASIRKAIEKGGA